MNGSSAVKFFTVSSTGNVYAAGNLGIGTTAPRAKLEVSGSTTITGDATIGGGMIVSSGTTLGGLVIAGAGGSNAYATGPGDLYVQNNLEVDGSVYLGDAVADQLHVLGTMSFDGGTSISGDTTITGNLSVTKGLTVASGATVNGLMTVSGGMTVSNGTTVGSFQFTSGNTVVNAITTSIGAASTDSQIPTAAAVWTLTGGQTMLTSGDSTIMVVDAPGSPTGNLLFKVNGSTSMIIDQNGNVGIGTTAPQAKLDISKSIIVGSAQANNTVYLSFGGTTNAYPGIRRNGAAIDFLKADSSGYADITVQGINAQAPIIVAGVTDTLNVAGTTGPVSALTVGATSNGSPAATFGPRILLRGDDDTSAIKDMAAIDAVWSNAATASHSADIVFGTVNNAAAITERARLTSAGRLGIGTTSPATSLDVAGNMQVSGGTTIDGLLRAGAGGSNAYATGPGDLYVQNNLEVDGSVYFGDTTTDTLTVTGAMAFSGDTTFGGNIMVTGLTTTGSFSTTGDSTVGGKLIMSATAAGGGDVVVQNGHGLADSNDNVRVEVTADKVVINLQ